MGGGFLVPPPMVSLTITSDSELRLQATGHRYNKRQLPGTFQKRNSFWRFLRKVEKMERPTAMLSHFKPEAKSKYTDGMRKKERNRLQAE